MRRTISDWWAVVAAAVVIAVAVLLSGCGAFLPREPMSHGDCMWRESKGIRCAPSASMRGKQPSPAGDSLAVYASATSFDKARASAWPLHRLRVLHAMAAGDVWARLGGGLALDKPGFFLAGAQAAFSEGEFEEFDRRKQSVQPETVAPHLPSVFEKNPASEARQFLVGNGAPECGHVVKTYSFCPHVHAEGSVIHIARAAASWGPL